MTDKTVLIVEDDDALREALTDTLMLAGYRVLDAADGPAALELLAAEPVDIVVTDVQMQPMDGHELLLKIKSRAPQMPILMMTAYGTIERAVSAMRDGAGHYLVKPFEADELVETVARFLPAEVPAGDLIASDPSTRALLDLARRVAASDATVMLSGESGTGKEVFARYIHEHSSRASGPFVAINCAAIPENMLEAVLFGYEKGAFTGANAAHPGKFEQANGGTLLLDEVSEMDLGLQAKLLRVLQEREVERLAGRTTIALDVRVLATTNRDLREYVDEGRFREDLYYRLNVFPLALPALRNRPKDILPLVRHAIARHTVGRAVPELESAAENCLLAHQWPGNVRELDNLVQRTMIMLSGDVIRPEHLVFEPASGGTGLAGAIAGHGSEVPAEEDAGELRRDLKVREEALILEALAAGNGNRTKAAERLGISPRTLRYKLARLRESGVTIPDKFGAEIASNGTP